MDWDSFADDYYRAAEELMMDPNFDIGILQKINQVLIGIDREPVQPFRSNHMLTRNEQLELSL